MSSQTPNLNLTLPTGTENWKRSTINGNFTLIDTFAGKVTKTDTVSELSNLVPFTSGYAVFSASASPTGAQTYCFYTVIGNADGTRKHIIASPINTGKEYCIEWLGSSWSGWKQLATYESGSWTPKLYDYETYKRDLASGTYIRIGGGLTFAFFANQNPDLSGISTMLQIRNLPMSSVLGGGIYIAAMTGSGGTETVQATFSSTVYFRPNITSSMIPTPSAPGHVTFWLIGMA